MSIIHNVLIMEIFRNFPNLPIVREYPGRYDLPGISKKSLVKLVKLNVGKSR